MKTIPLGGSDSMVSRLAYGCWRIAGTWDPAEVTPQGEAEGRKAVVAAYEAGYTLFDHADIYCGGEAERIFGRVLREVPGMRDHVSITTKCGIRRAGEPDPASPHRYDSSADHIVWSCEQSLQRLGVETIDLYQLHRPDFLTDPDEVASAFTRLRDAGKVRHFGVSNFRPTLVSALRAACPMPLVAHQVEISLARLACLDDGTLDQCLLEKMSPLAWSPLAGGQLGHGATKILPSQEGYRIAPIMEALDELARARGTTRTVIALAWLMRHPAGTIPIVGSVQPVRIQEAARADGVDLTREEWYRLLRAARAEPLP